MVDSIHNGMDAKKNKAGNLGLHFVLEIFRFRLRNAVAQTARNISGRRKLNFNLPLTVHAVGRRLLNWSLRLPVRRGVMIPWVT